MKILSNFDTKAPLEAYKKAIDQYGPDKVMFFRRYKIYFIFFVIAPIIGIIALFILLSLGWHILASEAFPNLGGNLLFIILFALIAIIICARILLNYINYLLDYTIITPHLITSWNQTGIFKREVKTLDTDKIKAITAGGNTFLQSLFNYGSIIFLSEGDEEDQGDIRLHYLHNPSALKDEVVRVINLAKDL